jgi:hypothetical protein
MSEGPPFPKDDQIQEGKQGGHQVEPFDPDKAIADAEAETADVAEGTPTESTHETHIPVERVTERPPTLTQKPFEELGSFKHLFKSEPAEGATPTQKATNQEKKLDEPVVSDDVKPGPERKESKRPVDGMRVVPKKASVSQPPTQGSRGGYAREQKELGKAVGEVLDIEIERAALERLRALPNWDKYRFTGELTEDGYLVEKSDEQGVVKKPEVRPSKVVYIPEEKTETVENSNTIGQDIVEHSSTPTQTETFETPPVPEGVAVEPGVGDTEGETSASPQEDSKSEEVQLVIPVEAPVEPPENIEPATVSVLEEKTQAAQVFEEKNEEVLGTPQSRWDGFIQVYEGKFDQQGNKLPGQGSSEEFNMVSALKKSETPDKAPEKDKEEKTNTEPAEAHSATEAHKIVRDEYRVHRKALLEAEKEWMDAVTEYERRRHESGMLGKHIFDFTHSKEQVDKALEKYNGLLDKTRAMREERTQAFLDKLQVKGGTGEPERMKGEKRIVALHEALLYSHVDQKAAFVERMRVGEGLKKESTNRFLNFAKQKGRAYAALPMHKKILYGTALSAGVGLVLGASGVVAGMGAAGGAALYGGRRLVGGTLGMGAAIGTKLGFNKFAEKRAAEEQKELRDGFSERNLSDALQEGVSIRKKERHTKNVGNVAAVTAAVAVGVGSSQAATEIYHSDAVQNSAVGKALTDFDAKAVDAGKAFKGWYEGMKGKIGGALDSAEQNMPSTQEVPSVHTVEPGDNVWDILQEKLKAKGVFEGMNERQRTHIIDALKDEVEALSPEKLKAMGIESGDPDLIHPGETIDLSAVLDKESISEAVAGAPGVSAEVAERAVESPVPVPESDVESQSVQPEVVPESQKPFTSQSHLDVEAQKPFTSESHLFSKGVEVGVAQQTVDTIDTPETLADVMPTDDGPRMKDFAGAKNIEQIGKDFPDYHGEKSLSSFNGVWEELKGQGKIDRHLLGRYPHLKSGWGPLSHVPVRDLYDNVQGVKYNIDGTAIELTPQAEGELRSFVELTRELPGGDMLEYCVENNKSVGDYLNAVAMREGLTTPEPTATLAATDPAQHVQDIPPEQSVQETTHQPSRGATRQQPERVKVDRPRYTKPLIGVGGAYQVGDPESGFSVKVGGGARLGGGVPIDYARIHLNDPIDPEVIGEYKAKYESGRFLEKNPQAATEWETKTAGELLESDPAYKKAWQAERRHIIDEAYRGRPVDLEPRDELKLQNMSGEDALKQLMDEEVTLRDNKKYRVTIRRRVL